jgi:TRAP-type transport system periplasmic protein
MTKFTIKSAGILAAFAIVGYSGTALAQITLHMGHNTQTNHPIHIASESFATAVAEATDGEVEIVVHPAEQLAALRAGAEGVQLGTVDLYASDSGTLGNWAPHYSFVSLPFMFADFDAAVSAMDALEEELEASMREDLNVERLGWTPGGFRVIMTSTRPVNSASDLSGLKIRVPEIPVYVSAFAALNANATPLPWGDVYSALQTGVVEGVEGPAAAIEVAGFQEVSKYMARTNHIMNDVNFLMNLDRFNGLSPEHQQALRDAAEQAFDVDMREVMRVNEDVAYDALAEVLETVDSPDVESFRAAMAPVFDEFIATAGPKAEAWIATAQGN